MKRRQLGPLHMRLCCTPIDCQVLCFKQGLGLTSMAETEAFSLPEDIEWDARLEHPICKGLVNCQLACCAQRCLNGHLLLQLKRLLPPTTLKIMT